jgi:1,4-alpha-glucan branching enzyme
MLTICRLTKSGKGCLLCHFNFSPVSYDSWRSGVLCPGTYTEVFNSNAEEFGGNGIVNPEPIKAEKVPWDYKDYSITYKLGAYGMSVFKFDMKKPKKK